MARATAGMLQMRGRSYVRLCSTHISAGRGPCMRVCCSVPPSCTVKVQHKGCWTAFHNLHVQVSLHRSHSLTAANSKFTHRVGQLAAHIAATSDSSTTLQLPPSPNSNDVGSFDACMRILQQHAAPGTFCPAGIKQQLRALAAAESYTLFLPVQCGTWSDAVQGAAAGQPAMAVMLLRPVINDSTCKLAVTALKLDGNGWPSGDVYPSPTAFEGCTTKDRSKYRHTCQVLPVSDASALDTTPSTQAEHSRRQKTQYLSLNDWLYAYYGQHPRLVACRLTDLEHQVLSSSDSSSFSNRRRRRDAHRQLPGLSTVARRPHTSSTSELQAPANNPVRLLASSPKGVNDSVGNGVSNSSASLIQSSLLRRAENSNGSWPFCTYTQDWSALLAQGRAAVLAGDVEQMIMFVESVDVKLLTLACDAEIAANRPRAACGVYDVLMEVRAAMQAQA